MSEQKDQEIERGFIVRQMPEDLAHYGSKNIVQGYLALDANRAEVRLRKTSERYFETFNGSGRLQRLELEFESSRDQFITLWPAGAKRG